MNAQRPLSEMLLKLAESAREKANKALLGEFAKMAMDLEQRCAMTPRMEINPHEDVLEFSKTLGRPWRAKPGWPMSVQVRDLRRRLIEEEKCELFEAMASRRLDSIAQEGVDLLYVTYGLFVDFGINPAPVWAAVHEANMRKTPNPNGGKVLKPEGWKKPAVWPLIREQML